MKSPKLIGAALVVLCISWAASSEACPGCIATSERSAKAFFNVTVLLSLLPLGMIGGGVWWLRRRWGGLLAGEFEDRDAWPPAPPARAEPTAPGAPARGPIGLVPKKRG